MTAFILVLHVWGSAPAQGATTKIGNGDDGSDLEGFELITSGPIVEARKKAGLKLRSLNVGGIPGLGTLIPEVEKTSLYRAKRDLPAMLDEDQGTFHTDMRGLVFARTFAEPHAPTRFFPVAESLDMNQLVSLHIHEALHRSLPPEIRENEAKVAALTLSLSSPGATHDRARKAIAKVLPEAEVVTFEAEGIHSGGTPNSSKSDSSIESQQPVIPETAKVKRPTTVGYTYTQFYRSPEVVTTEIRSIQTLSSQLFAFGSERNPIGLGLELSVLKTPTDSHLGPLGLSARTRLWSSRAFDVEAFGTLFLNTLSAQELKNSPFGRDITRVGISLRKDTEVFFVENSLHYNTSGKSKQQIGNVLYEHKFGAVLGASVRGGARLKHLSVGLFGEILLADYYRVEGGAFSGFDSGRYEVVAGGPEIIWQPSEWALKLWGKSVLTKTKDASFDYLGNILGEGAGQGGIGLAISVNL